MVVCSEELLQNLQKLIYCVLATFTSKTPVAGSRQLVRRCWSASFWKRVSVATAGAAKKLRGFYCAPYFWKCVLYFSFSAFKLFPLGAVSFGLLKYSFHRFPSVVSSLSRGKISFLTFRKIIEDDFTVYFKHLRSILSP